MSRVRGLLSQSGEWQCDCSPRLPAIWLEVRKNNQNKGRHFYTCQKPQEERCGFFLWDTDAEKREKAQFGETLAARKKGSVAAATAGETSPTIAPPAQPIETTATKEVASTSKQVPVQRLYPRFPPPEDDEFEYFDTPTKSKAPQPRTMPVEEDPYDWEESDDDEAAYKKNLVEKLTSRKRPRSEDLKSLEDFEDSLSLSPPFKKPNLADPFTTPPKQVTATPHTPPETRATKSPSANLLPVSHALLQQLGPHAITLGTPLWQAIREHILKCGRVADGAVKGRDAARSVSRKKDIRVEELETRVKILEAEREVDRAVIGALKRNVDILTGKTKRTD